MLLLGFLTLHLVCLTVQQSKIERGLSILHLLFVGRNIPCSFYFQVRQGKQDLQLRMPFSIHPLCLSVTTPLSIVSLSTRFVIQLYESYVLRNLNKPTEIYSQQQNPICAKTVAEIKAKTKNHPLQSDIRCNVLKQVCRYSYSLLLVVIHPCSLSFCQSPCM